MAKTRALLGMAGILKIEIAESSETLSNRLKQEKNTKRKERIQALFWIKTNLAESIGDLSSLRGKHRTTGARWLSWSRKGGLSKMLDIPIASGRTPGIPPEIKEKLINELNEREGLSTYKEIPTWLYTVHDLKVSYKVVQDTVRYRLKGKLKVARRSNANKTADSDIIF